MKHTLYKTSTAIISFVLTAVFIILGFAPLLYAQAPSTSSDWDAIRAEIQTMGESVSGLEIPYLEAQSIELMEDTYGPGDVVTGIVTVRNGGTVSADRIVPTVSLVGNFENLIPTVSYDIDSSQQSFNLAPRETKRIYFEYKLPGVFLSNDLGIQVEFYTDTGLRQDVVYTTFKAKGPFLSVDIPSANLTLRDMEYDLRVTPAVYDGDAFSLDALFITEEAIDVVPHVSIHVFSSVTGQVASKQTFDQRTIPAGQSNISLDLDMQIPAGLYEGVATFTDPQGNQVAPTILFLFMMMGHGEPFMIRNITASLDETNMKQQIFRVSYTGGAPDLDIFFEEAPAAISTIAETNEDELEINQTDEVASTSRAMQSLKAPDYSDLQLAIIIKDNTGKRIGGGAVPAGSGQDFIVDVPVDVSSIPAGMYTVTAEVTNSDGTVIDTYTKEMLLETGVTTEPFNMNLIFIVIVALLIVILIPISLKMRKGNNIDNA